MSTVTGIRTAAIRARADHNLICCIHLILVPFDFNERLSEIFRQQMPGFKKILLQFDWFHHYTSLINT